ncbi:DUF6368 family protein [Streptomyces sp. NPDC053728]|uniref:DUF6368 family protein n=1 Tax=Streptomyces sp. NPDC053728 TaxID=3155534 RepID=UPI0034418D69
MSGPAVGLWLFEQREFGDVTAEAVPWLEGFCDPVEIKDDGDLDFWVRAGASVGLSELDRAGGGVFFLSEDKEIPAEDENYSDFPRPPVQGLVLGASCSGPENHLGVGPPGTGARRAPRRVDRLRRPSPLSPFM